MTQQGHGKARERRGGDQLGPQRRQRQPSEWYDNLNLITLKLYSIYMNRSVRATSARSPVSTHSTSPRRTGRACTAFRRSLWGPRGGGCSSRAGKISFIHEPFTEIRDLHRRGHRDSRRDTSSRQGCPWATARRQGSHRSGESRPALLAHQQRGEPRLRRR